MFMRYLALLILIAGMIGPGDGAALAGADSSASATEVLAVRARLVYTLSDRGDVPGLIENGTLLIRDGRIVAVGGDIAIPSGVRVVDFREGVIIPGLVYAGSTFPSPVVGEETVSAKYRAVDEFNPFRRNDELLAGGVTAGYLFPGDRRLVSGVGAVVKTAGADREASVVDPGSDLCVNLCASAYGPPPIQDYPLPAYSFNKIEAAAKQRPSTRLGQYLEIRDAFQAAGDYALQKRMGKISTEDYDYNLEILSDVMARLPMLRIRALRAADIEGACSLAKELKLKAYVTGCHEAYKVAGVLSAAGLGAVVEVPFRQDRPMDEIGINPGRIEQSLETAAGLAAAGVPVALAVPGDISPAELLFAASLAVRGGLPAEDALRAVTRSPAELMGVADRVGSLEPGRDADFVVLTAAPFDGGSHVREVFVEGRSVYSFASASPAGAADALVVRAGTIFTAAGPPIVDGAVLIEDGKVRAVGRTVPVPPGARVVDAGPGACVTPGLIDAHGHLGLEGDRTVPGPEVSISRAVAAEQDNFRPVAKAGVTTVVMAPQGAHSNGSRVAAIKTAGSGRDELVVDELAAFKFSFVGKDPVLGVDAFRKTLKKGKDYDDSWKKYHEELKKWEEEQAKKKAEGDKAAEAAKKAAEEAAKKEAPKPAEGEEEEEKPADPVSGTWEGTLSGGPVPEPMEIALKLKLDADGATITGSAVNPMSPEEAPVSGTLQGKHVVLTLDVETPMGAPVLEADIDREDHMTGTFKVGDVFSIDFEAERTEKETPVIKVSTRKKKKDGDGRPEPPKVNKGLEPFRKVLAGEIPLLVQTATAGEIEAVLKVAVDEFKVPVVLLDAGEAYKLKDRIAAAKTGVVAALPLRGRKDRLPYVQVVDLSRSSIPVMFQSNAEDGARSIPDMACFAVRSGMDPTAALEAATINPAKLYHIDDRVGSLQPGRDGDLVIFSGNPFDGTSRVLKVFVAGKEVGP